MATQFKTPVHLWIVGALALLWNAFGAVDYLMTRLRNLEYLSQMGGDPNALLAHLDSYPIWAQFGWGLGVWSAVIGSLTLLARSRYAVWAFGLSLVGMALSFGYQYFGSPSVPAPAAMTEGPMAYMPIFIIIVGIALFLYARKMQTKGLLR